MALNSVEKVVSSFCIIISLQTTLGERYFHDVDIYFIKGKFCFVYFTTRYTFARATEGRVKRCGFGIFKRCLTKL